MVPAPFQLEGSTLPVRIPMHFESFYRIMLRRVVGSRIRSVELRTMYLAWAASHQAPSMSFVEIRRTMEAIGHRRIQSNGVHYADLIMADDVPHLTDTLPKRPGSIAGAPIASDRSTIIGKVDAVLASLLDLRRAIVAETDRSDPAAAASRILGLFDR